MNIPTRRDIITKVKSEGGRIAAVMPFHYPRALLRAFNIHPMEVWGPPHVDDLSGGQHFPEYTCKIVTRATRFLQSKSVADVDYILTPHTCDSLQGMASILKDHLDIPQPVVTLYHPRGRRPSDYTFMLAELRRISEELAELTGKNPSQNEFLTAIDSENRALDLFRRIAENRHRYVVSDRDFFTVLRAREYLPAEDFISQAESLPTGTPNQSGPGLMLSGIVPEPMHLFDHIQSCGAHVLTDDLACCSRRLYDPVGTGDPLKGLAEHLLSMPPDTTVSTPYAERFDYLLAKMKVAGAKGVIVYDPKFCEPELFYIPMFEKAVKAAGFGFLHVEVELGTEIPHTVLNRIDAFIEVLT